MAWSLREAGEKVELEWCERQDVTTPSHRVTTDIDRQVTNRENLRSDVICASNASPDAGDKFFRLEGLDDVIIGPGLQPHDDVDRVRLCRQHDDRRARFGADRPADVYSVSPRQHKVEQNDIGLRRSEGVNSCISVGAENRVEPLAAKDDSQHLSEGSIVIDDKNATPCPGGARGTGILRHSPMVSSRELRGEQQGQPGCYSPRGRPWTPLETPSSTAPIRRRLQWATGGRIGRAQSEKLRMRPS